jgi:hypothetical protein
MKLGRIGAYLSFAGAPVWKTSSVFACKLLDSAESEKANWEDAHKEGYLSGLLNKSQLEGKMRRANLNSAPIKPPTKVLRKDRLFSRDATAAGAIAPRWVSGFVVFQRSANLGPRKRVIALIPGENRIALLTCNVMVIKMRESLKVSCQITGKVIFNEEATAKGAHIALLTTVARADAEIQFERTDEDSEEHRRVSMMNLKAVKAVQPVRPRSTTTPQSQKLGLDCEILVLKFHPGTNREAAVEKLQDRISHLEYGLAMMQVI